MFGGGGMNPRKMQQMMKQMGIDVDEIDAEQVVITTTDGEEIVFDAPQVTQMNAQGTQTYQIVGDPTTREASDDEPAEESAPAAIPADDIQIVATRAGVSEDDARAALEEADGDLAVAIASFE
ncbi:nascent polypeptide-associated complex protein [Natronocalculus amylovorans]|uniref:Nascent polypeptide-associated complex protein n=1 Tax=Natronocalculus amylovorans TaxID=2917812 RepID=A0AAE3K8J6_9EURY|nr:nascent polypeptide-associated complex protein [Natronocalculus amylovorans]MCL9817091.1 nascent polypeptide-associated complex protein [Natronocalculus amylovorans]